MEIGLAHRERGGRRFASGEENTSDSPSPERPVHHVGDSEDEQCSEEGETDALGQLQAQSETREKKPWTLSTP